MKLNSIKITGNIMFYTSVAFGLFDSKGWKEACELVGSNHLSSSSRHEYLSF
jgi:hypothetical protein